MTFMPARSAASSIAAGGARPSPRSDGAGDRPCPRSPQMLSVIARTQHTRSEHVPLTRVTSHVGSSTRAHCSTPRATSVLAIAVDRKLARRLAARHSDLQAAAANAGITGPPAQAECDMRGRESAPRGEEGHALADPGDGAVNVRPSTLPSRNARTTASGVSARTSCSPIAERGAVSPRAAPREVSVSTGRPSSNRCHDQPGRHEGTPSRGARMRGSRLATRLRAGDMLQPRFSIVSRSFASSVRERRKISGSSAFAPRRCGARRGARAIGARLQIRADRLRARG